MVGMGLEEGGVAWMGSGDDIVETVGALLGRSILAMGKSAVLRRCPRKLLLLNTDLFTC